MGQKKKNMPAVVLGLGLLLAVFAGILSPAGREDVPAREDMAGQDVTTAAQDAAAAAQDATAAAQSAAAAAAARKDDAAPPTSRCSEAQAGILRQIYEAMEAGDFPGAASCMEHHKEELTGLLTVVFGGRRYLYDGKRLTEVTDQTEGRGIVLTSASTVFYGNFQDGRPEGAVTAIQGLVLEEPRYDYAIGTWKDGKMNGSGTTGYTYYEGTGEQDGLRTEKSGQFRDDNMEGEVRYTSINRSGDSATWIITAVDGVTEIDGRWQHREARDRYILPAENDASHGYVLKEDDLKTALWKNRITWQ